MKRRYLMLFAGVVLSAVLLSLLGRMPRTPKGAPVAVAAPPRTPLEIAIHGAQVTPATVRIDKGSDVDLVVVNRGARACRLTLSGYEDRVAVTLEAGERRVLRFLTDRPGDDFAWFVDGQPAGRFVVAGSHLVEGHR